MAIIEKLDFGFYYHIYNRGNNRNDIFFEKENYLYFLKLYDKYISPVADTYCWCLLKNHFHFLIKTKEFKDIEFKKLNYSTKRSIKSDKVNPSKQFSHLFNAYTQAINKRYSRTGSVFQKPFQRKIITNDEYIKKLIFYIHNNPVHHGYSNSTIEYKWSSYHTILSNKPTNLMRDEVIELFDNLENFKYFHKCNYEFEDVNHLILE